MTAQHPVIVVVAGELPRQVCAPLAHRAGFVVVGYSGDAHQLIPFCCKLAPCILVVDEQGCEMLEAAHHAKEIGGGVRILVITDVSDDDLLYNLILRRRAAGVAPSDLSATVLAAALHSIMRGEFWVPRRILARLVRDLLPRNDLKQLTPREEQILQLLSTGRNNREIAEALSISRETVRWHLRSLYDKLGTRKIRPGSSRASQHRTKDVGGSQVVN